MNHLTNQELARLRYADVLRSASRQYARVEEREAPVPVPPRRTRALRVVLARTHLARPVAS